ADSAVTRRGVRDAPEPERRGVSRERGPEAQSQSSEQQANRAHQLPSRQTESLTALFACGGVSRHVSNTKRVVRTAASTSVASHRGAVSGTVTSPGTTTSSGNSAPKASPRVTSPTESALTPGASESKVSVARTSESPGWSASSSAGVRNESATRFTPPAP